MARFLIICTVLALLILTEAQRKGVKKPSKTVPAVKTGTKMGPSQVVKLITEAVAGKDFPAFALDNIPDTGFSCDGANIHYPGYYADPETGCQSFHYCPIKQEGEPSVATTFLCPNYTIFDNRVLTCRWFYEVDCLQAVNFYDLANSRLYVEGAPLLDD